MAKKETPTPTPKPGLPTITIPPASPDDDPTVNWMYTQTAVIVQFSGRLEALEKSLDLLTNELRHKPAELPSPVWKFVTSNKAVLGVVILGAQTFMMIMAQWLAAHLGVSTPPIAPP